MRPRRPRAAPWAAVLLACAAAACGSLEQAARDCHPSYPGPCMWPPPPDLDCADIVARGFTVLPPDPHGFDPDGDGLGCEPDELDQA